MSDISSYIRDKGLDAMRIAGRKVGAGRERAIEVGNPYTGQAIGSVPKATLEEVREAFAIAHACQPKLTRYERAAILNKAAAIIRDRLHEVAALITAEAGLCIKDAIYEAGRVSDVLLFGATGVFSELQEAFERLWLHGTEVAAKQKWWHGASLRLRGVAYVLAFGFLLLTSLAVSTLLNLFSGWAGQWMGLEQLLRVLNELVSLLVCTALFVALMRMSAGPKPQLRYLVLGGFVGAILFSVGKQVLAIYLSTAAVVSAYGAAGSLVVLLMWIYFSSAVLLFAAGCAKAVEDERKRRDKPDAQSGSSERRWASNSASADTTLMASSSHRPQL